MRALAFLEKYDLLEAHSLCGKNLKVKCFFHEEDTASLSFNLERDTYYCFGCNESGDLISAICHIEQCSRLKALEILAELEDIEYTIELKKTPEVQIEDIRRSERIAHNFAKYLPKPTNGNLEYLAKRGFSQKTIDFFNIRENPHDIWPVVIPIYELGKFKGVCKRRIDQEFPKYRYNDGFKVKRCVGLYIGNPYLPIFLCEGIMDAISAWEMGYPNVASQFGWSISEEQLKILSKYDIICALDADEVGEKGYRYLKERFNGKVSRFDLCGFKDINEMLINDERKFQYSLHKLIRRK